MSLKLDLKSKACVKSHLSKWNADITASYIPGPMLYEEHHLLFWRNKRLSVRSSTHKWKVSSFKFHSYLKFHYVQNSDNNTTKNNK